MHYMINRPERGWVFTHQVLTVGRVAGQGGEGRRVHLPDGGRGGAGGGGGGGGDGCGGDGGCRSGAAAGVGGGLGGHEHH